MIGVFDFIILALASGRVAYSITSDVIFEPMRNWIFLRSAPDGVENADGIDYRFLHFEHGPYEMSGEWGFDPNREPRKPGFFGQLFQCIFCFSFWTSLVAMLAYWVSRDAAIIIGLPFAVWAVANLISKELHS